MNFQDVLVPALSWLASALTIIIPFIWKVSSWKTSIETKVAQDESRLVALESLDIWVQLAKIFTTLAHIEVSQNRVESILINKK